MVVADTNIVLELLERRKRFNEVKLLLSNYQKQGHSVAVSSLTVSNVFYIAEAHKLSMNSVEKLIKSFEVHDVGQEDVSWAAGHYHGQDFEDALQVASSIRHKCQSFLTLDKSLAKKYQDHLSIDLIA